MGLRAKPDQRREARRCINPDGAPSVRWDTDSVPLSRYDLFKVHQVGGSYDECRC
jgi:hypothetical protein